MKHASSSAQWPVSTPPSFPGHMSPLCGHCRADWAIFDQQQPHRPSPGFPVSRSYSSWFWNFLLSPCRAGLCSAQQLRVSSRPVRQWRSSPREGRVGAALRTLYCYTIVIMLYCHLWQLQHSIVRQWGHYRQQHDVFNYQKMSIYPPKWARWQKF